MSGNTKLATVQQISSIEKHPNADLLEIVSVLGYKAIVKKDQWKVGDFCVFIVPDTVLPDAKWAEFYKAKSSRVKAVKLRNVWSEGIVESVQTVGYAGPLQTGLDITDAIGVTKYEPPLPQDLSAKGLLPFNIPKTDEERFNSITDLPYGELVDVTLKIDGQSCSFYWKVNDDDTVSEGVLGRTMEYKWGAENKYSQNQANYDVLNKISFFCRKNGIRGICVRGESYGSGIQKFSHNPHASLHLGWAMFSVWLMDEKRYARKGDKFYFTNVAKEINLPTVPLIEENVVLTPELISKYCEGVETLDGKPFEGVVIQHSKGSFKVINKSYDSKK